MAGGVLSGFNCRGVSVKVCVTREPRARGSASVAALGGSGCSAERPPSRTRKGQEGCSFSTDAFLVTLLGEVSVLAA